MTKDHGSEWIVESSVKRCLDADFNTCDDISVDQGKNKNKNKKKVKVVDNVDVAPISN